jgi:hypothetical protein
MEHFQHLQHQTSAQSHLRVPLLFFNYWRYMLQACKTCRPRAWSGNKTQDALHTQLARSTTPFGIKRAVHLEVST